MRNVLIFFAAGCVGGLANSLTVWWCGDLGITQLFGVAIAPSLSPAWLYPRIVWGGIWGLLFMLPVINSRLLVKGLLLSLLPTAVQLFVVFPLQAHKGIGGLELGLLTPVFVVIFNGVWGVVTALTIRWSR